MFETAQLAYNICDARISQNIEFLYVRIQPLKASAVRIGHRRSKSRQGSFFRNPVHLLCQRNRLQFFKTHPERFKVPEGILRLSLQHQLPTCDGTRFPEIFLLPAFREIDLCRAGIHSVIIIVPKHCLMVDAYGNADRLFALRIDPSDGPCDQNRKQCVRACVVFPAAAHDFLFRQP